VGGDNDDDVTGGADANSVSSDALFSAHLDTWEYQLIPIQIQRGGCSLWTEPGGKNSILYMTAICIGGIMLVIIPLLALTTNQLLRLQRAAQEYGYGALSAYHLDDISKLDLNKTILPNINTFKYESSTLMFLLCLPQFLADSIAFRNALLWARGLGRCFNSSQFTKPISTQYMVPFSGTLFVN